MDWETNPTEEAVYPLNIADGEGKPIDGANKYVIHFKMTRLPAEAFWSITMYDKDGFPIANPIIRFAIRNRDSLKFNSDGSLDIYIQRASSGAEKETNVVASGGVCNLDLSLQNVAPIFKEHLMALLISG